MLMLGKGHELFMLFGKIALLGMTVQALPTCYELSAAIAGG